LALTLRLAVPAILLLRRGGKFSDRQISKYLLKSLLCFGIAVFALVAVRYVKLPYVGLIVVALAIPTFKANVRRWSNWYVGKRGEVLVAEALKSLPNEYVLLNDLVLPEGGGNVDHLVIGPNGLFVIETKNYSGSVKCQGDIWCVNGRKVRSLSKQAKRNAIAIKRNLEAVFTEHRTRVPFVNALLVFANSGVKLNLIEPTVPVLRASELPRYLAEYHEAGTRQPALPEVSRAIVHHLLLLQPKPDQLIANQ